MNQASRIVRSAPLRPTLVRRAPVRRRQLRLPPPAAYALVPAQPAPLASGWGEELRFFLTCYCAAALFILIMLS